MWSYRAEQGNKEKVSGPGENLGPFFTVHGSVNAYSKALR